MHNRQAQPTVRTDGSSAAEADSLQLALSRRGYSSSQDFVGTFCNPILPAPSADPWIVQHQGVYYYCESRHQDSIFIRRANCLTELHKDEGTLVWSAPAFGRNSRSVWAPELHFLEGKWYIYYAADDGLNENHRMWVLESASADPMGPYHSRGCLETPQWAIDGTVLKLEDKLYFIWSGWPGAVNGQQNLYISAMRTPWALSGERVLIAKPELAWECQEMSICEGPQVLQKDGKTFVIYSASGSWSEDYCLGLLELTGSDPLDSSHWVKRGCIFHKNALVHGVGHCSFVQSPDQSEDWVVYHTKTKRKHGWNDRTVHAQRFTWSEDGLPFLGTPVAAGIPIPLPSRNIPIATGL